MRRTTPSIPASWEALTLGNYAQLLQLGDVPEGPDGLLLRVAALSGCDVEDVQDMDAAEFSLAVQGLAFMAEPPGGPAPDTLGGRKRREMHTLTLGEFADLEREQDLAMQLAAMYPEDLKYDPDRRRAHAESLLSLPMSEAWPALAQYRAWREGLYRDYAGLFHQGDPEEPQEETPAERNRRMRELEADRARAERWNWFGVVYRMAQGDPLRFDAATELPLVFALNFLSYCKENNIGN